MIIQIYMKHWPLLQKSHTIVNSQARQEWMNSEILDLMEQRRKCRRETRQYKQLDKIIRSKCSEAKTNFYNAQCVLLENWNVPMHSWCMTKWRKLLLEKSHTAPSCIETQDGSILIEKDKILKRWKEYINELFANDRGAKPQSHRLPILEDEVVCALKGMAKRKAAGPDGLTVEM